MGPADARLASVGAVPVRARRAPRTGSRIRCAAERWPPGLSGTLAWLLVFGLLGTDLRGYVWWTVLAGTVAWLVALLLVRQGDRGVAVGIAITTAVGWAIAATAVAVRWAADGGLAALVAVRSRCGDSGDVTATFGTGTVAPRDPP